MELRPVELRRPDVVAAELLATTSCSVVAITRGASGAVLYTNDLEIAVPGPGADPPTDAELSVVWPLPDTDPNSTA